MQNADSVATDQAAQPDQHPHCHIYNIETLNQMGKMSLLI